MLTLVFKESQGKYYPYSDDAKTMALIAGEVDVLKLELMKRLGYTVIIKGKVDGERVL